MERKAGFRITHAALPNDKMVNMCFMVSLLYRTMLSGSARSLIYTMYEESTCKTLGVAA